MSGPITALAAASPQRKVTSGPCGGGEEGPQGRNGSVNPLALHRRGTITMPERVESGFSDVPQVSGMNE